MNLYGYCRGGPVGGVDTLGLWETGSYGGDVLQVLKGYWDVINPVNIDRAIAQQAMSSNIENMINSTAGAKQTLDNLTRTDDLRSWGSSFLVCDVTVVSLADTLAGAGGVVGVGSAESGKSLEGLSFDHPEGATRPQIRAMGRKLIKNNPNASAEDIANVKAGRNPTATFPGNGRKYPMHWSHEDVSYVDGGTRVVLRAPWNHPGFVFVP